MTADEQANIDRIESERRKREAALLILLLLLIDQARRLAGASIRMGLDPALPIRQVILGDPSLHLPGLTGPLANAMADSYLTGYRRAHLMADVPVEPLSAEATIAQYIPGARGIAAGVVDSLVDVVRRGMYEAGEAQLRTAGVARYVMRSLTRFGWTKYPPQTVAPESKGSPGYAAVGVSTEAVLAAFNDGMWNGYRAPAVAAKLTAFTHHSVMDHRTSDICIDRDTLTLAPDDPFWLTSWPKLHPRCRSIVLPHFKPVDLSTWRPTVPVQPGFGVPPATMFGYRFRPAA